MKILPNLGKAAFMFMSNKDLPPYGKALAWAIAIGVWLSIALVAAFGVKELFF